MEQKASISRYYDNTLASLCFIISIDKEISGFSDIILTILIKN